MPAQSRRASGGSRRSHHATAAKNASDSTMRRNRSVVALTGAASYPSLISTGRKANAIVPASANNTPVQRYAAMTVKLPHGRSPQMGEHQAPQGRGGLKEGQDLHAADQGNRRRSQAGRRRSEHEPAAAPGDGQGPRGQHGQGQRAKRDPPRQRPARW